MQVAHKMVLFQWQDGKRVITWDLAWVPLTPT
jgi:hypothetical protein